MICCSGGPGPFGEGLELDEHYYYYYYHTYTIITSITSITIITTIIVTTCCFRVQNLDTHAHTQDSLHKKFV